MKKERKNLAEATNYRNPYVQKIHEYPKQKRASYVVLIIGRIHGLHIHCLCRCSSVAGVCLYLELMGGGSRSLQMGEEGRQEREGEGGGRERDMPAQTSPCI